MPHTKQAKKRIASSLKRKSCNKRYNTIVKNATKAFISNPTIETYITVQKNLDRAKSRGIMHSNKVNRLKSRAASKLVAT